MNHLHIYNLLITKRQNEILEDCIFERHHIVPSCMGGTNDKSNIVKLTPKEHFTAHALLFKHYRTAKLAHAWFCMLRCDNNQDRHFTAGQYEAARMAHVSVLKETMKGEGNPFYGKTHTEESRLKISEANKGRKKSQEEIDNWVNKVASKPKTEEHKRLIGRKGMQNFVNINTGENIRVMKEDINLYDSTIWINPYAFKMLNAKNITCPHCGKIAKDSSTFKRWHFEKCKAKGNII